MRTSSVDPASLLPIPHETRGEDYPVTMERIRAFSCAFLTNSFDPDYRRRDDGTAGRLIFLSSIIFAHYRAMKLIFVTLVARVLHISRCVPPVDTDKRLLSLFSTVWKLIGRALGISLKVSLSLSSVDTDKLLSLILAINDGQLFPAIPSD